MAKYLLKIFVFFPIYIFFRSSSLVCVFHTLWNRGPILSITMYTLYIGIKVGSEEYMRSSVAPVVTLCVGVSQAYERLFLKSWEYLWKSKRNRESFVLLVNDQ